MLKSIKSWFVIEEEAPMPQKATKPVAPGEFAAVPTGESKREFLEILFDAMEANNAEGFDYLEFKKSLQSLQAVQMEEATRYRSAFAMAQTLGATPEKLLQTGQHYLDVLNREAQKFQDAAVGQRKKLIGTREQEIAQLERMTQDKMAQIKKLNEEVEQHQQQMAILKTEIAEATAKMEDTIRHFTASHHQLAAQIAADMESIKKHLQ